MCASGQTSKIPLAVKGSQDGGSLVALGQPGPIGAIHVINDETGVVFLAWHREAEVMEEADSWAQ